MRLLFGSPLQASAGRQELRQAARAHRGLLAAVILFSFFANLLMLTAPLYMLQIYDRVLTSRSEPTLVALSGIVIFLFLIMGLLDHARARLLTRIGAGLQARLDPRVFRASLARARLRPDDPLAASAQRDLEALQRFWSAPIAQALIDLPWVPLFLTAIFIFHPMLGGLALAGGATLILLTLLNQHLSTTPILRAQQATLGAEHLASHLKAEAEVIRALGMTDHGVQRWLHSRMIALHHSLHSADLRGLFQTLIRTLRLFLQSAMLGLGAWLVLRGSLGAGAMIAASILMGRALAPIEQAVAHWFLLTRAREGDSRLEHLLSQTPPEPLRTALPPPQARLRVESLSVMLPELAQPVLRNISFHLDPGQALGIIGPSGAGKSTLGRVLVGALRPLSGKIRFDQAELSHYDPEVLGRYIGYLPQHMAVFEASLAETIARLDPQPDAKQVVEAARAAAAHEMILQLPQGYDTRLTPFGLLSGGQLQRLGLARALYGAPQLLILDEPNAHLDNEGINALNRTIRRYKDQGKSVIIIAHRPEALQECELLLLLEAGQRRAFGPRDDVLREMAKTKTELIIPPRTGDVA